MVKRAFVEDYRGQNKDVIYEHAVHAHHRIFLDYRKIPRQSEIEFGTFWSIGNEVTLE